MLNQLRKRFATFLCFYCYPCKNRTEVGVVYDPIRNELFTAVRGEGAKLNEVRLRVDSQNELKGAILATGFPFKQPSLMPTQFAIMNNLIDEAADFRRTGLPH